MRKIKKPLSILLSLILVFSLFTVVPLSAGDRERISYLKRSRNADRWRVVESAEWIEDSVVLSSTDETIRAANNSYSIDGVTHESNGWNVVNSDITIQDFVVQGDNVNLLICNDAKLTGNKGLICDIGSTIYANGGAYRRACGDITINGGVAGCDYRGLSGYEKDSLVGEPSTVICPARVSSPLPMCLCRRAL